MIHVTPLYDRGHRICWERGDGVIYTMTTSESLTIAEAWSEAEEFFRLVGCSETPEGIENT